MSWMLSSVASDGVNRTIVSCERNIESDNGVASFDEIVHIWFNFCFRSSSGQELSYLIQKSSFTGIIRAEISIVYKFWNIEKIGLTLFFLPLTLDCFHLSIQKSISCNETIVHSERVFQHIHFFIFFSF